MNTADEDVYVTYRVSSQSDHGDYITSSLEDATDEYERRVWLSNKGLKFTVELDEIHSKTLKVFFQDAN